MKTKVTNLVVGILVLTFIVSCNNQNKQSVNTNTEVKESISKSNLNKQAKLKSSFVCYVNNSYMGREQIPVEVDGKTYYGCCEGCVDQLKNIRETRYAVDPLTGNEVDKAVAYIVLKPNGDGEVLYFESEDNALKYL